MTQRTVVHLVRHGEVHNPDGILYGRLPGYHLSDLGHRMAQRVAEHFAGHDITHLVSSPLERAQQTMAPLQQQLGLDVRIDERVIEAANDFEGGTVGSNPKQLLKPKMWPKLRNPRTPSWGEPYQQIALRMREAVAEAKVLAAGHEAVVVSHQLPVWIARLSLEGRRLWHDPRKRECALASVTSLTFDDDRLVLVTYQEPAGELLAQASRVAGA